MKYLLPPSSIPLLSRSLVDEKRFRDGTNTTIYFKGGARVREYGLGGSYRLQHAHSPKRNGIPVTPSELPAKLDRLIELPTVRYHRQWWSFENYNIAVDTSIEFFRPRGLWRQPSKSLSALLGTPDARFDEAIVEATRLTPRSLLDLLLTLGRIFHEDKLVLARKHLSDEQNREQAREVKIPS